MVKNLHHSTLGEFLGSSFHSAEMSRIMTNQRPRYPCQLFLSGSPLGQSLGTVHKTRISAWLCGQKRPIARSMLGILHFSLPLLLSPPSCVMFLQCPESCASVSGSHSTSRDFQLEAHDRYRSIISLQTSTSSSQPQFNKGGAPANSCSRKDLGKTLSKKSVFV